MAYDDGLAWAANRISGLVKMKPAVQTSAKFHIPAVLCGTILLSIGAFATAQSENKSEPSGELLYSTYCIGCHTTEVHWRDKRLATDWASLKFQVRRWEGSSGLRLDENDVSAVAIYLNELYYYFTVTDKPQSGKVDTTRRILVWQP